MGADMSSSGLGDRTRFVDYRNTNSGTNTSSNNSSEGSAQGQGKK